MTVSGNNILKYIPQRAPIVMVDCLYESSAEGAETGLTVQATNLFASDGRLQEPGIVEHIAQSAALQAGYFYVEAGKNVPLGYIAAVKDLQILDLPRVNAKLRTKIHVVHELMGVTIVTGSVFCDSTLIANCEMKIFIRE